MLMPDLRAKLKMPAFRTPFARLSWVTLGLYILVTLSGVLVTELKADLFCEGWPLCTPTRALGWLSLVHRLLVAGSILSISRLFLQAWRTNRSQVGILTSASASLVLFAAQALLGSRLEEGQPSYYILLHQATAIAVWIALLLELYFVVYANRTAEQEQNEANEFRLRQGMGYDLLLLTKPVVVLLLLVTTFAGMLIGAKSWPSLGLTFWTMVGGFMAAGGSGAINQYIDRRDDQKMQRTQKRPIPSGRLLPAEGLAFGVAMLLGSFYIMVAYVNIVAALLCLAGMIYYVVVYSLVLKKTTVQNIVIGGGAGAIPPLVGWAAATGSLNIPALFLFAVVFMWTPPHFWALALVRRNDYARAGVPMLPVIKGEKETRKQILIFTLELVVLTLLLPVLGLGGSIYLFGATVLGLWLLHAAWKVWRQGGNKLAWKMYRYSSMYLAFLFFVLAADALL
jgi:protoheme IX farnesyltransferase